MQSLAVLGKPPPSCPRRGNALFHTMGKEKQQETKRNINMKYAQLLLCMGRMGLAAWEPVLGQRNLRGCSRDSGRSPGGTEGPFPSQGSDVEPLATLEIISALAKAKETPCPPPQASRMEDSQRQTQLALPACKLG